MATYLDAAGPTGAPAVIIHPDSGLPTTWGVLTTWEHDGGRGAWIVELRSDRVAQVVYDVSAPFAERQHAGTLDSAASRLQCRYKLGTFDRDKPDARARLAYYTERGIDIRARDHAAWCSHRHAGQPGPDDPYVYDPAPPPAPPLVADEVVDFLIAKEGFAAIRKAWIVVIHPDSAWPLEWQRVTINGQDWALGIKTGFAWTHFVPVEISARGKVYTARGIDAALDRRHGKMWSHAYDLNGGPWTFGSGGSVSATVSAPKAPPAPPLPSAGPPPEPGIDRAKWIGDRIAAMTSRESTDYLPHTRRRIAAHRALSIVAGYSAEDAVNDGLTLPGGFLLHLEGLNAYAARAFAGQED